MGGSVRPAGELLRLAQHLRDLLDPAHLPAEGLVSIAGPATTEPAMDIRETDQEVIVEIELPGCLPDRFSLVLHHRQLVVSGEFVTPREPGAAYLRVERPRGRFVRSILLPVDVAAPPEAALSRGVLTVRLRRAPAATRRRIPVEEGA